MRLCSTPALAFPDFSLPFILYTDASQSGIGAVLSQEQGGGKKVIAYASRTLTKAEGRYSVTRKELLAVVTYIHHFRRFREQIKVASRGYTPLKNQKGSWQERLQEYTFEIKHWKGHQHQNVDALSRYPAQATEELGAINCVD